MICDSNTLRALLIEQAGQPLALIADLKARPVFLLGPESLLGVMHGSQLVDQLNVVACVDDRSTRSMIHGAPRFSSARFAQEVKLHKRAIAIDLTCGESARSWAAGLCVEAGIEIIDCLRVQAELGLVAVYEPVSMYRDRTLARLDEFLALAERFDDELSRRTLFANLLMRITCDRQWTMGSTTPSAEEYFSIDRSSSTSTIQLGDDEAYCDCGAFQGPIVKKFIEATRGVYRSITAFEPDKLNFDVLQRSLPSSAHDVRLINKAVSSHRQTLRFHESGTVSSYVSSEGNVVVSTTRLDDELDELSFLKMDVEGFEAKTLQGAAGLLTSCRPRIAACVYHYAQDLLDVVGELDRRLEGYHFRLRQHQGSYFYDLVLYASPERGIAAPARSA